MTPHWTASYFVSERLEPDEIIGANASGPRQFAVRMPWTARVAQFCHSRRGFRVIREKKNLSFFVTFASFR